MQIVIHESILRIEYISYLVPLLLIWAAPLSQFSFFFISKLFKRKTRQLLGDVSEDRGVLKLLTLNNKSLE